MDAKYKVTVLYDAAEDVEKAKAQAENRPYPVAAEHVTDALTKRGHAVRTLPLENKVKNIVNALEKDESDILFNLCESIADLTKHEHNLCGLLELMKKPFTGSGSAGQFLAQDKALSKKIFQFHDLPFPRFCTMDAGRVEWSDELMFPLFVKPLNEDASIGIDRGSVVHNVKELLERISHVHDLVHGPALVEEFIDGREIYVGVLGNDRPEPLPILEWDFSKVQDGPKIASAEAKWDRDSEGYKSPEFFPEDIPEAVVKRIQDAAVGAFQALRLADYARVDLRLRRRSHADAPAETAGELGPKGDAAKKPEEKKGTPRNKDDSDDWEFYIIEINANPWLEKRSEFAMAGRKHGLSYPDLLERIIELALRRHSAGSEGPPRSG